MKKNGFTLIEIIAVVTILAVMLLVSLPALTSTLKNSKEKKYNDYLDDLYMAAENYVVVNDYLLTELNYSNGGVFIKISDLINTGYVASNKENPKTESNINPEATIRVTKNVDNTYGYSYFEGDATNSGYSSEALILKYDGYQITGTTLKDLASNNDAIMTNFTNGWQGNSILFDGVNDYLNSTFATTSSNLTLQFVLKYSANTSISNIYNKSGVTPSLNVNTSNYLSLNGASVVSTDYKDSIIYLTITIDATGSKLYINNVLALSDAISGASGTYRLFSVNGATPFKGNVYAVRAYEKVLTPTELLNNYNVDMGRYN